MKLRLLAGAVATALVCSQPAVAGSDVNDRLSQLEARIKHLEGRVADQDQTIREKDRQISTLEGKSGSWWENVEMGGVVEIEASRVSPFEGDDESDLVVSTVEFGIGAQLNDWTSANVVLLWEEDSGSDLSVDEAVLTFANPDVSPFSLTAGHTVVPFGAYETQMVSDTLAQSIGEAKETAVIAGFEQGPFTAAAYLFNGDLDDDDNVIDNAGVTVGFGGENFSVGLGYISDIGDSDGLSDVIDEAAYGDTVAGASINGQFNTGPFTLLAEYVTALDDFDAGAVEFAGEGARPAAFGIEAGYTLEDGIAGRETTFAISYQKTKEALALELPEERVAMALTVAVTDNASLGVEWAHDTDYEVEDGGTGENADTLTALLSVEF